MNRQSLIPIVERAVRRHHGTANHTAVAKFIWDHHQRDLQASGAFFYKWQYEARWAADELKRRGVLEPTDISGRGVLQIKRR